MGEMGRKQGGRVSTRPRVLRIELAPPEWRAIEKLAADNSIAPSALAGTWVRLALGLSSIASFTMELDKLTTETVSVGKPASRKPYALAASKPRQVSLHHEIARVLRENGTPMGAGEIAEAIRAQGRYRSPRAAKPVSAASVSSRASNPLYRDLFQHAKRKIALAEDS